MGSTSFESGLTRIELAVTRLHLHVVGEGDRAGVGLAVEHADADDALPRLAEGVDDAVAERRPGRGGRGRSSRGSTSPSAEIVAEPLSGWLTMRSRRHHVAVGVHAEAVELDERRLAAQHAALERLRQRGAVRVVGAARCTRTVAVSASAGAPVVKTEYSIVVLPRLVGAR